MSIIQLNKVTKKYGEKIILDKFSLEVREGEFIAIMGQSGCGKSTLLNIIGLLESYDDGDFIIDGDINVQPSSSKANKILREKICYLFQNFALVDDETVSYNLNLAMKYVKEGKKDKRRKINEVLKSVDMEGFGNRKIYELSGGEQQRVAVARIMLKTSKIILADEPTGSLDESNRDIVLGYLKKLNLQGKTIVIVTHDKFVASQCEKIINM